MEEEGVKKGAKGRPSTSLSYSGSDSESDDMKMVVDSGNEDKSSTAENTAKDDGQEEIDEEEDEEEESDEEDDDEEEESDEDEDDDDDIGVINKTSRKKMTVLESESSDDGEGDDCPICLNRLKYQDIGTPEACDHNFCLDCIQLWARNVNTCPVDRREFQLILARHAKDDEIFKRIPVSGKSCQNEDDDEDVNQDFTYCELCGRSDREDRLLLCDGCDLGFHCECLDPPLDSVPVEEWFCPDCAEANTQRSGRLSNDLDDDMQYLLEENSIDGVPYLRPRRRRIARTRISERVRARIQEYREGLARLVCDDEEPEASDEGEGPSTRLSRTRSQTRQSEVKRKQPSRKKTKKGRKGKQKSSPKKKLRRRTRTAGKTQIFDRFRNARTSKSKSRLAGKLGSRKSRMALRKSDRATAVQILKEDLYGAKPLSIMGGKHDLDPFVEDDSHSRPDEPQASTSVFSAAAAKRSSKYSASALLSRQPVARPLLCKLPEDNPGSNLFSSHCSNSGASSAASNSGGLDLLGSIMMDQSILHLESKDVKINRDGSLTAKKAIPALAVEEPKKYTSSLFFDSKGDENSSVHMDSDNEESRNNNAATATQVDCEKEDTPEPTDETIESDIDGKFSDDETRDSDSETKPSNFESANEMSVPANQDDDDDEQEEKDEKNESENAEDSVESNEAVKAEDNEDSCSRDGLDNQTELNEENMSPQKDVDRSYNSEAENDDEEEDNAEEEDEDKVTYKEEQKDDNLSEHVEEEKAASELGSSGFSPAPYGSPGEKSRDMEQNSDAEDASSVKEAESLSDEENVGKDASISVEKMESAKVSESVQDADEQQAATDADDTEDEDVTAKGEEVPVKSVAEENKDVDETGPKSDAEDEDTEMQVKSDAEDEDTEMQVKSDAEDEDTEMQVKSDAEDEDTEMQVKSDAEDEDTELQVKSDADDEDTEIPVKSDADDEDTEIPVKSDAEDEDTEIPVKSDAEDEDTELQVKSDAEDEDTELQVKSDAEDEDTEIPVKSDAEDLDTEEPPKSDAEDLDTEEPVKSDADGEENVLKETEEEATEASGDANKFVTEENSPDLGTMQDDMLPSESNRTEEEFLKAEESDDNGEALAAENLDDQNEEEKDSKLEVADEASENFDDAASKDSEDMVKTHHEELQNEAGDEEQNEAGDEEQNEAGDEDVTPASGSESDGSSAANEEEENEEQKKPKVPISELPRIPKRNRREGYRREKSSKGDGPELKSVLGRVDMPEYKMGRTWDKKDSRRSRWENDDWSQSERDIDCASNRDRKSEGGKSYHSDRSESSRDSEKYSFEHKESKSRKRRRDRSRSRSRGRKDKDKEKEKEKDNAVEYRDIPHRRHSPERSKSRRRDRSRNRSRSGSREKSFDHDKSHKRKSRGRSRDRSQSRKSRRHRSYSRSPSRKRDKERSSSAKRRHREERRRGEERGHKRHSDKSDPEESRKKRQSHEEYDEWDEGSCQVVDFDESTSPKAATGKKSAECFYESHSPNEEQNENFFNRRTPQDKNTFKGDKMEDSGSFYSGRSSSKKHRFVDRFYKAPHLRHTGTEKFPISLSEDENDEFGHHHKASRSEGSERDRDAQDSGDSEYDPAFPTESGSPFREGAGEEPSTPPEGEPDAPVVVAVAGNAPSVTAAVVAQGPEEIASSGPIDETPPAGSQGILGDSGFMLAENPNLQNIPMQPQNITFPMGIRMMPPGMQPGMPQHLLMNHMFLNRPPPFSRLPRISGPVGRLGWSMNPSGIMQIPPNRFGPTRMGPGGGMPPRPGLLNGGFEGMPQEPGQPMAPFKQHPCDPRSMPSHTSGPQGPPGQIPRPGLAGHPPPHMPHIPPPGPLLPHPQQHPPPPPPSSQQMHIPPPTSDTLSLSSLDSQTASLHMQHGLGKSQPSSDDKSVSSNFRELNQITKLLEAQINKQRNTSSLQGSDIDVFKIPLPPMAPPSIPPPTLGLPIVPPPETHNFTSTTKSYKNGQSRLLANSHTSSELASESTEVVDMDVASPLDDEIAIELPASPELDDIDESKINMKDSAVIELLVPEDMPASAVELTNLTNKDKHTSRVKKSNPKASQQRTASPTSTKTSHMGYMKKLQIQERVVDEVKLAIKPFYSGKKIDKDEYKEILRKAVPKICHSKSGNINPAKIKALIEAYVDKMCKTRKYMERKKKCSLKANGERIKKPSR